MLKFWPTINMGALSAVLLLTLVQVTTVHAQKAVSPVEEITVTARKRVENLQDVPVAISAFSSEDLQVRDIVDLEILADQTPGLNFATNGSITTRRAVIRGMSQETRVGDETNVATIIDGVYTPGFTGAEFFGADSLERIEVIKGPQSAIYGRNSFSGAINYVTKKPTYEAEYGGRLTAGEGDRGGVTGYLSGPIIKDTLALRLDGGFNSSGGSFKNTVDGKTLGSTETKFARLGAIWDPTDRLNIFASLSYQEDEINPVAATLIADDDPRRIGKRLAFTFSPFEFAAGGGGPIGRLYDGEISATSDSYTIDPRSFAGDRKISRLTLQGTYQFNGFELVSLTGYQERKVESLSDFNTCRNDIRAAVCDTVSPTAVGTFFGSAALVGAPFVFSVLTGAIEDRNEISEDLRLQSTGDGRLQWSAGVYMSKEEFTDQTQRLSDGDLISPAGNIYALQSTEPLIDSSTEIENRFYSIYGSLGYDFSDRWNLSAELRTTREEKQSNQVLNVFPSDTPPTGFQDKNFRFTTPRVILSFNATDDLLTYASAAKGVKSGGFNPGSVDEPTFDQEENWSYELGSKYTFWNGRGRLNTAAYYIDWDDQQITDTDPDNARLPITTNVAKTEIYGIELEAFLNPTDWLQFNLGISMLDAEYKEGKSTLIEFLADCAALPIPCDESSALGAFTSGSVAGRKVIGTPDNSVNFGAQVNYPVGLRDWSFLGRLDYSWQDRTYVDLANAGYIPERNTLNLRVGLDNANWSVQGFCNNVTDDNTPLYALPPRDILGVPHLFTINRNERLCGLQVGYRS
jgi:outer membrane receptor protein involved in Fe transport